MKHNAVLGSYIANSPLAAVDARVKLLVLGLVIVGLFAFEETVGLALGIAVSALALVAARCTPRSIVNALKPAAIILAFSLIANSFVLDGTGDISLIASVGVNLEGMQRGFVAVARIVLMVMLTLTIATSTTPPQLSDAFMSVLKPFERFGLPARDISMVLSIALRFIPMVADEIERIRLSQMSRGVRLDQGGIVERLRSWISVIVPLVVVMFVRADALAEAMECRAYGTHDVCERTAEKLTNKDRTIAIVAIMLFVMLCALEISI